MGQNLVGTTGLKVTRQVLNVMYLVQTYRQNG